MALSPFRARAHRRGPRPSIRHSPISCWATWRVSRSRRWISRRIFGPGRAKRIAQDDFKLNPRLTISAGVRWSYFGQPTDDQRAADELRSGALLRIAQPRRSIRRPAISSPDRRRCPTRTASSSAERILRIGRQDCAGPVEEFRAARSASRGIHSATARLSIRGGLRHLLRLQPVRRLMSSRSSRIRRSCRT